MEQSALQAILEAIELHSQNMNQRFDQLDSRMDSLEGRMDSLEDRMDSLETRMDSLEGRMDSLEEEIDHMKTEVHGGFSELGIRLHRYGKKEKLLRDDLTETQETVDYLVSKNLQHEKKLRSLALQNS